MRRLIRKISSAARAASPPLRQRAACCCVHSHIRACVAQRAQRRSVSALLVAAVAEALPWVFYAGVLIFFLKSNGAVVQTFDVVAVAADVAGIRAAVRYLDWLEQRFDAWDKRLGAWDQRFDAWDQRFDAIDATLLESQTLAQTRTR